MRTRSSARVESDHGTPFDTELGLPALATYHPAYLLRLGGADSEDYGRMRAQVVEDLAAAWEHAQGSRSG